MNRLNLLFHGIGGSFSSQWMMVEHDRSVHCWFSYRIPVSVVLAFSDRQCSSQTSGMFVEEALHTEAATEQLVMTIACVVGTSAPARHG